MKKLPFLILCILLLSCREPVTDSTSLIPERDSPFIFSDTADGQWLLPIASPPVIYYPYTKDSVRFIIHHPY